MNRYLKIVSASRVAAFTAGTIVGAMLPGAVPLVVAGAVGYALARHTEAVLAHAAFLHQQRQEPIAT